MTEGYIHAIRHGESRSHQKQIEGLPRGSRVGTFLRKTLLDVAGLSLISELWNDHAPEWAWKNDLTRKGRRQAREAGDELAEALVGQDVVVIASPTLRARHTADIIAQRFAKKGTTLIPIQLDQRLKERGLGLLDPAYTRYEDLLPLYIYYSYPPNDRIHTSERPLQMNEIPQDAQDFARRRLGAMDEKDFTGESLDEVDVRIEPFLEEIRQRIMSNDKPLHVILVSHKTTLSRLFKKLGIQKNKIPAGIVTSVVSDAKGENWKVVQK